MSNIDRPAVTDTGEFETDLAYLRALADVTCRPAPTLRTSTIGRTVVSFNTRLVWSTPMPLPEHLSSYDIRLVATQRPDGTIVSDDAAEGPLVYIGGDDYTPGDVRVIATALLTAADLADKWTKGDAVTDVPDGGTDEYLADRYDRLRNGAEVLVSGTDFGGGFLTGQNNSAGPSPPISPPLESSTASPITTPTPSHCLRSSISSMVRSGWPGASPTGCPTTGRWTAKTMT